MLLDPLSNMMSAMNNCALRKKKVLQIHPSSKLIEEVLRVLKENHFIGDIEKQETPRGIILTVNLLSNINKCGSIKPRFPVTNQLFEGFEKQFLPAKNFGLLIVTTPKGVMTHADAKKQNTGGRLLAYCY